ncbi:MAG: hypothetical protein FJ091_08445 [Deltaproteobacteria bacterium]|nr:hypothetical protein [Deltaproteobacteria bacterium]
MTDRKRGEDKLDAKLRAFFRQRVVPLAERTRARREQRLPAGPDAAAATYYEPARRSHMAPLDFTRASGLTRDTLEAQLRALWQERGDAELAALAPELARLARECAADMVEQGEELSPFVYVMY